MNVLRRVDIPFILFSKYLKTEPAWFYVLSISQLCLYHFVAGSWLIHNTALNETCFSQKTDVLANGTWSLYNVLPHSTTWIFDGTMRENINLQHIKTAHVKIVLICDSIMFVKFQQRRCSESCDTCADWPFCTVCF